jgi:hypothetical protein
MIVMGPWGAFLLVASSLSLESFASVVVHVHLNIAAPAHLH